jgi:hypothetical protein
MSEKNTRGRLGREENIGRTRAGTENTKGKPGQAESTAKTKTVIALMKVKRGPAENMKKKMPVSRRQTLRVTHPIIAVEVQSVIPGTQNPNPGPDFGHWYSLWSLRS